MDPISIRFNEEYLNHLKRRAEKHNKKLSDYLKHLIDLGLQVENAQENHEKNDASLSKKTLEALQMKTCKASMESVLLLRSLHMNSTPDVEKNKANILTLQHHAETLLSELLA